mmetsp:Transcript_33485/g.106933  ORF Transcript_33485/g.106933 Transcript_33485/m.106933 type:complete len:272 (+) Transcript_33485:366-1181(+)
MDGVVEEVDRRVDVGPGVGVGMHEEQGAFEFVGAPSECGQFAEDLGRGADVEGLDLDPWIRPGGGRPARIAEGGVEGLVERRESHRERRKDRADGDQRGDHESRRRRRPRHSEEPAADHECVDEPFVFQGEGNARRGAHALDQQNHRPRLFCDEPPEILAPHVQMFDLAFGVAGADAVHRHDLEVLSRQRLAQKAEVPAVKPAAVLQDHGRPGVVLRRPPPHRQLERPLLRRRHPPLPRLPEGLKGCWDRRRRRTHAHMRRRREEKKKAEC